MFNKRFSVAHWDATDSDTIFYDTFCNSSAEYKNEIKDIYFGGEYKYEFKGQQRSYGEIMGVLPSTAQVDNLFRIQDKFGVEISLTLNSLNIPKELSSDPQVLIGFITFLDQYYQRGLRSCTISCTHLMRTGKLQEAFPEMRWKNTVNHLVKTTQELYDFHALGYNTLIFDRSLNRDADTLKEMYREAKKLGIEVSLLATESCMPSCPFKGEHDSWQSELQNSDSSYWGTFNTTCNHWRNAGNLPRIGTNISMATKELVEFYMEHTDVLKFSGRLNAATIPGESVMCWSGSGREQASRQLHGDHFNFEFADSFKEIYENNLAPYIGDRWMPNAWKLVEYPKNQCSDLDLQSIWVTDKGVKLSKVLHNCKNKCWDCHLCEKTFEVEEFDSVLSI